MNSSTTETVSADAGVSDYAGQRSARQDQNRDAQARWRARRRLGLVTRRLVIEREWLDALEERGYLDPDDRDDRRAQALAVETANNRIVAEWARVSMSALPPKAAATVTDRRGS